MHLLSRAAHGSVGDPILRQSARAHRHKHQPAWIACQAARRKHARLSGLSVGALAERVGMHPSTLTRDLKPLIKQGLIQDRNDPVDRRIRKIFLTQKGEGKLRDAIPAWRRAQRQAQDVLGNELMLSLNELLDLACAKLPR